MRKRHKLLMRRFNISMNPELVDALDKAADDYFTSRSEYIRIAVSEKIEAGKHTQAALENPQSYFNMIGRANVRTRRAKSWNKLRFKDIDWFG